MKRDCNKCHYDEGGSCKYDLTCRNYNRWVSKEEIINNAKQLAIKAKKGTTEEAKHYQISDKQPIEIMQDYMTSEQFIGFLKGNVIKYLLRIGHKDNDLEDSGKALQYAKWLCVAMNGGKIVPGGKS